MSSQHLLAGRYQVIGLLGQGGMATVSTAFDVRLDNRLVAIKEMTQIGLTPDEIVDATEAFQREADILAHLQHPNLPSIYDAFTEAGRWYLVMEFIEGETLEDRLDQANGQGLPIATCLDIGDQLCAVLDYLHSHRPPIIFRDLKPSNIQLTPSGRAYVIDFGIARLLKPGQAKDTVALGSPGYAPPEQYGKAQTTARSDLYSLGAVLHQMLTGADPSIKPFQFESARVLRPAVPAALDSLVQLMVSLDAERRPATVALVRHQLQGIAAGVGTVQQASSAQSQPAAAPYWTPVPTTPRQPLPHARTAPRLRRIGLRWLLAGFGVVIVVCVCASLGTALQPKSAPPNPQATVDQAVSDATAQLNTDLGKLNEDVQSLAESADFNSTLAAYAKDWAQMEKDFQKEQSDYQQGCGAYGYNATVVSQDATVVSVDLTNIQVDDTGLNVDNTSRSYPLQQVQTDMQTVNADWQALQAAISADRTGNASAPNSATEVDDALARARQQVDASQLAQSQASQYDQEAAKMNTDAENLAASLHC
jgi:serine/threonine protein kinase